ncbi:hypothetical protein [Pararhizobium antarcticum]|uniref:Uncharacterized protein n=1 Tax=Pararhizobium antarcticum TaxID=1798805 RepID=A0A657LM75_9HYPH|nr:hypothetical protein [Pararhizobium antarcticum]OJF90456.1 hypothetical protein AX761_23500 [Rhizobium sp. 58]OJF90846.1 hypothetical protein AX760_23835 [Pararhizobium antarcticum]
MIVCIFSRSCVYMIDTGGVERSRAGCVTEEMGFDFRTAIPERFLSGISIDTSGANASSA